MSNRVFNALFKGKSPPHIRALSWITAFALVGAYFYFTNEPIETFKPSEVSSWNKERMNKLKNLKKPTEKNT